jgi:hypothetical protein
MMARQGPSWGGKKRINLFRSRYFTYYRNSSLEIDAEGAHGGLKGRGWRLRWPGLGDLTHSIDSERWSWNTPGWGRLKWSGGFREGLAATPLFLKLWCLLIVICHSLVGALMLLILVVAAVFVLPHVGLVALLIIGVAFLLAAIARRS